MGRLAVLILVLAGALVLPAAASAQLKAGVGDVDASWHVGAASGQYASDGARANDKEFDPHGHTTRRAPSYGLQSRLRARALVVEGPDGKRIAIVKQDLYLPQDLLWRRAAQIIESKNIGITRETFSMVATHNHSSPYYSSPSWGVWTFQDAFDVRAYEYYAQRLAAAVEEAATNLKPVRVGGAVRRLADVHRSVPGPETADDGTPAGFPQGYGDHDLIVVRFDDISDPANPKPLANLVNYAVHPENLADHDLISADYLGPLERMLDRETGAMTIFSQGSVGSHEPERSQWHEPSERRQYYHGQFAQAERLAREVANAALGAFTDVGSGQAGPGGDPERLVPFQSQAPVDMVDRWFPGPVSHPVPTVSGCRTDKTFQGDPRVPGPPECLSAEWGGFATLGVDTGLTTDTLQEIGIPVPENISLPAYSGLEETMSVHLQAFRIGDILFTLCSCEQWHEQSRNIKTRTNRTQGDQWNGFVWDCQPTEDGSITQRECDRMRAQVLNDAAGWNDPENAPYAESEPTKLEDIKGNYTHSELPADQGYKLTVAIGMANDYNGYIATYREYQRGDHYRKSLTGWGPHSSDYMATRLVGMGGQLNGGEAPPAEALDAKTEIDMQHNNARAEALGQASTAYTQAYEATLPDDAGAGEVVEQPEPEIKRFDAVTFTWTGGSNYTDLPEVRVQRLTAAGWEDFADQSGEIPVTVKYPETAKAVDYLLGQRWEWTAHFEAFVSEIDTSRGHATPAGTYRFVVDGQSRQGGAVVPYEVASEEFDVRPWDGITVEDLRVEPNRAVSFQVGPRRVLEGQEIGPIDYPDSYEVSRRARFIQEERVMMRDASDPNRVTWFCFTCSFRPWVDTGNASQATVTIVKPGGKTRTVPAFERGGRWVTDYTLRPREQAFVAAGGVLDRSGNLNGAASGLVPILQ